MADTPETKPEAAKPDTKAKAKADAPEAVPGSDGGDNAEYISVKTTGDFMVLDPYTGDTVKPGDAQKVRKTSFIQNKIDEKKLEEA